jgi:hypothetical protein
MHRSRALVIVLGFVGVLAACVAVAQDSNYPGRKPIIVNMCPFVELSGFSFQNRHDGRNRFETHMSWKNIGTQPLTAFEIVILKYDAFDRRLIGERWTVTGVNSADWRPLQPGAQSADGTIGLGEEEVFTAIAYVRAARLADNTVWAVNDLQLITELRKVIPGIKNFGDLKPDPKTKAQ